MKKALSFVGFASLLLASCTNDSVDTGSLSATSELGVKTQITGVASTRALTDAFAEGDQLGVFVKGGNYVTHLAAYTCSAIATEQWISPSDEVDKIYLANELATVYAFYPYNSAGITNSSDATQADYYTDINVNVPYTQQFDAADVDDYMYATTREGDGSATPYTYPLATASNAADTQTEVYANKVNLYMHHALSKLSFVVNKDVSYQGTGTLSAIGLVNSNNLVKGSYRFQTGSLTMSLTDGTIKGDFSSNEIVVTGPSNLAINAYASPTSTTITTSALVAPCSDTSGILIALKIDDKVMSATLPSDAANSTDKWLAGKNYTYTITVKGTGLVLESVNIVPWDEISAGNTDMQ